VVTAKVLALKSRFDELVASPRNNIVFCDKFGGNGYTVFDVETLFKTLNASVLEIKRFSGAMRAISHGDAGSFLVHSLLTSLRPKEWLGN
jgi:hypothetical protein